MKKFILLIVTGFLFIAASNAQALTSQYGLTVDTVTNTGTKYLTSSKVIGKPTRSILVVSLTEISGTTGGTISLEASMDGSNWYSYYGGKDTSYSFTPTDLAGQSFRFSIPNLEDYYLRVKYVGTGTMSDKISAILYNR